MKDSTHLLYCPAAKQWEKIGVRHHHGIAVPLFSIHSSRSYGIGEYTDLPLLIDWCTSVGLDVVQLLPLNDTGLGISPYGALSAFALNPIFIGLDALPHVHTDLFLEQELRSLPKFSYTPLVEYAKVRAAKERFLSHYFGVFGSRILKSDPFKQFIKESHYWLKGYAVYKILKERNHSQSWETWPDNEKNPTKELIQSIAQEEQDKFNWFCFVQFICDQQFRAAKIYGEKKGIRLMGDIPILIDRDSADVWIHRDLFNLNFSAGAPPDYYSEIGQNWGFPIYNWEALANQEYTWWKKRLTWADRYYQLYRIDHIVGFFRIWAIPLGLTAKDGHFEPADENTWIDHGQKILLMMINGSDMLPIGEDLGLVPPEARKCLTALGICGTRVMRWERFWNSGGGFIPSSEYAVEGMTTVSTHDSETLSQWWKVFPAEAELFAQFKGWTYHPNLCREHLKEMLWDSHHSGSLFHINLLQEYLNIFPQLSWPNIDDDRINIPGEINDRNWRFRFRPSLEELMGHVGLKNLMQELIS